MAGIMIADTGCANLASVRFAFDRLGAQARISNDPGVLQNAERLILPGVGAASAGMAALAANGLQDMLRSYARPLLGICLGMQLLYQQSAEAKTKCLGLITGTIEPVSQDAGPVPHMGWNTLDIKKQDPLLGGVKNGAYVYFVHSYAAKTDTQTLASTNYGPPFSAIIRKDNIYGCQFHPERSGPVGAQILRNFLDVNP